MILVVKAMVSAIVILVINATAQRSPALGGWLAGLPTITLLSILWLVVDGADNRRVAGFVTGAVWGLIPSALCLIAMAVLARRGLPLVVAVGAGLGLWVVSTLIAQRFSLFGL